MISNRSRERYCLAFVGSPPAGLSHSRFVGIGSPMAGLGDEFDITPNEGRPCSAFPNVFHPDFEAWCRYRAEIACRPGAGDPWLFGYFLDNELAWWGRGDLETGLFDAVMKKSADHSAKRALRDFLAQRYQDDIGKLNAAWGCDLPSFDQILRRKELGGSKSEKVRADKEAFLARIADRYFSCTTRAIRAVDPDHLILGCRFAGGRAAESVWAAAARYCDALTLNYYGNVDLDSERALDDDHNCLGDSLEVPFAEFARLAGGKPLLVTEWSFIALDSGLPCTHGAGQRFRTQEERARAAGIFAETLLRIPEAIGFDYFMWADEPALGISSAFPENSNYGLVDGENRVYEELVHSLTGVLQEAGRLRREGDAYEIRNGRLTLTGKVGAEPELDSIRLDGVPFGNFVTTAHQFDGGPEWPRTSKVLGVEAIRGEGRLTVELTGRFEEGSAGRVEKHPARFRGARSVGTGGREAWDARQQMPQFEQDQPD